MKIFSSSQKADLDMEVNSSESKQERIYPYRHDANTSDGSEFLDDAIRMNDQPLGETTVKEKE